MMKIRNQLVLLAGGIVMAVGCSSRAPQPVAVAPPPPPPPPPPAVTQPIPLRPLPIPSILGMMPEPRFDPAEDLVFKAQAAFERGERNYAAGHLEMAKQEFNEAIAALLLAPPSLREDKRVQKAFDTLVDRIHAYELAALKQGDGFAESTYQPAPLDELQSLTIPEDLPLSEQIQEEAAQTVSDIPLVINGQVGNLIKYFTSGRGRSALEAGTRASGRFREMILRVLKEEQVPLDLFYLAQAESAFRPRARSRAGALGIWQFMPSRGKEYGLARNWWADERMNPEKATRAAARHLKDLYGMFGDWYLAMAAYNCGPFCVSRAVERTGYADFWQLSTRRALPSETRNYIPIVLALTFIGKNAQRYGLDQVASEDPWVYDTATVSHPVDLRLVAEIVGTNVETIRELNPSLLRMTTPNGVEYTIRIPLGTREVFQRRLAMIPPDKWVWWRWHAVH
ncbi:MAG: lytic transglycosylase domain-containing protein, partial [Terriglobia bacterium]